RAGGARGTRGTRGTSSTFGTRGTSSTFGTRGTSSTPGARRPGRPTWSSAVERRQHRPDRFPVPEHVHPGPRPVAALTQGAQRGGEQHRTRAGGAVGDLQRHRATVRQRRGVHPFGPV